MINTQNLTTLALALCLSACNGSQQAETPSNVTGLRITAEVATDVKAERISVLPNDIAPWLSQILLLSDGQLYRTSAGGGKAQAVNAGDVKDMIGLMRKGKAGTALTLTKAGKISALIEKDDEGRLARMNVSTKAESYDGFCQNLTAPNKQVIAYSGKDIITLDVSYESDQVVTIAETKRDTLPKRISSCHVSGENVFVIANGQLVSNGAEISPIASDAHNLTSIASTTSPTFLFNQNGNTLSTLRTAQADSLRKVIIEDGLSVTGTQEISNVFTTADNLGGTFSEGAVIAQDAKTNRLILIARPFAQRTLSE